MVIDVLQVLLPHASRADARSRCTISSASARISPNYFVFGLLLFRAIRMPEKGWAWRWAFLAVLIAALYASSDEIHQIFVPSRGASIWDALLDTGSAHRRAMRRRGWRRGTQSSAGVRSPARASE